MSRRRRRANSSALPCCSTCLFISNWSHPTESRQSSAATATRYSESVHYCVNNYTTDPHNPQAHGGGLISEVVLIVSIPHILLFDFIDLKSLRLLFILCFPHGNHQQHPYQYQHHQQLVHQSLFPILTTIPNSSTNSTCLFIYHSIWRVYNLITSIQSCISASVFAQI
jgi:hypothetical protein